MWSTYIVHIVILLILCPWISIFQLFAASINFYFLSIFQLLFPTITLFSYSSPCNWCSTLPLPPSPHFPPCLSDHDYNSTGLQPKMLSLTDLLVWSVLYLALISPVKDGLPHCWSIGRSEHTPDTFWGTMGRHTPKTPHDGNFVVSQFETFWSKTHMFQKK